MKRTITWVTFLVLALGLSTAFIVKDSNGKAGYTGSLGEATCAAGGCHGGGTSTASGVTVAATPSFTNDEYIPGTVYDVSVTVAASGFTRFGFGCEVLNSSNTNIGTMQNGGTGVKFVNASNGRKNATHTSAQLGSSGQFAFRFQWVAPAAGQGSAVFYYCGNAVNNNGNTSGDLPIPGSYTVAEGVATVTTGLTSTIENKVFKVNVFPNPTTDFITVSYQLKDNKLVVIELVDLNGKKVKTLLSENQVAGANEKTLKLDEVESGIYFIKLSANGTKLSQKMIVVN